MTAEVIVLPGEGIGPEVIAEAVKVLEWFRKHRDVHLMIRCELYGTGAYEKYGVIV
ncbi:MAG: 3-isopropylmalate dehydrogenase, partial [Alphaproteobacteria bacterium MarineAlpha9_Bin7]